MLRGQIYRVEIEPGRRLWPSQIAKRCQVTLSTVRKAFFMLQSEGIIEQSPHGFRVIQFTETYIGQIFTVRRALETAALRACADRFDLLEIQIEMPQLDKLTYFSQFFWLCLLGPHPRAGLKLVI
jgi:DNA-binding GntR family transcriptional regulator